MEEFFLKILNMSIAACWIILAVIAARFLLKKAPKWIVVAMWGIAGLRLVCPFTIESVLSLIPSAETVPEEILYTNEPAIHTGVGFVNEVVNPVIYETLAPSVENTVKPAQSAASVAAVVWVVGMGLMLAYMAFSYIRVYARVREAAFQRDNVWVGDAVDTPFVLGVFRPRIYLPSALAMNEVDMGYVVAHEKAHLKRRDNWWKPAGFLILAVHWFNPLVWLAYILLCRDIEFACDEKVIKALSVADRKAYSNALINCSAPRRLISACPLAFGENGVKSRIKSVLNYKKPAFWIILAAIIACIVVAVCFLTNPKTNPGENNTSSGTGVSANEPQQFSKAFDKLSITVTTDKTEYVIGEDKIAEVTATVKNTSGEKLWLLCGGIGKNVMLETVLELPESEISLIDLDSSFGVDDAIDEKMLEPGEEYVQKMRFDLLREAHPFTKEPIPPAEPGEYKGTCGAFFVTDENRIVSSEWEKCSLDFKIAVKQSTSAALTNDPQKFSKAFDKLSMTLTTDKTEYVLGEDKIAEVTAAVKNTSGEKVWLYSGYTGGKNFMLRPTLELPGSGISLLDLDYFPAIADAIDYEILDPGEEYVQKMRFDLTGEGYHPLTDQLLPPVEPGEYQGKCIGVFHTDQENVKLEECSLDFKIVVKPSPSAVLTNDPQKFSKTFENLAMTVTTDKTAYFLGEDKIAEVTATVKNVSGKTLWLHCNNTGDNIMLPASLKFPDSETELIDLDKSYLVMPATDEIKLEPGEEYVQKMRFDLVREGLSPMDGEPLIPAKPGVYRGGCGAIYAFDKYGDSDRKAYHLNFQILLKERNTGEFVNSSQKFAQDFDKLSFTVTSDKAKYVIDEDKIARVTAVVKNTSDKSIFLYCGDLGRNHMIYTKLKHWQSEMNLIDLDSDFGGDDAENIIELKPGEEYTQVMRFDLARDQVVSNLTGEKLSLIHAEPGWYLGTCQVRYLENRDDDYSKPNYIGFRIALVNDINDDPGDINDAPAYDQENDNTISENDVKTVIDSYPEDRPVHDAQLIDLDFDGDEELLVLVSWANPNVFEVWEKNSGKMELTCRFGAGKLNWIDKISLEKGVIDGERVYLFSFSMSGENSMTADEVLSVVKKTADGYEVEHLLSRGRIDYAGIPEPFTKEFYRKGWSKYDIGMDADYGDITKEEYIEMYKNYTGITLDL